MKQFNLQPGDRVVVDTISKPKHKATVLEVDNDRLVWIIFDGNKYPEIVYKEYLRLDICGTMRGKKNER